jgi:hypothetical protein
MFFIDASTQKLLKRKAKHVIKGKKKAKLIQLIFSLFFPFLLMA